ncbi:MAG: hypothetical protein ABW195_18775 [Ilumatobacteraceae bacterium]
MVIDLDAEARHGVTTVEVDRRTVGQLDLELRLELDAPLTDGRSGSSPTPFWARTVSISRPRAPRSPFGTQRAQKADRT